MKEPRVLALDRAGWMKRAILTIWGIVLTDRATLTQQLRTIQRLSSLTRNTLKLMSGGLWHIAPEATMPLLSPISRRRSKLIRSMSRCTTMSEEYLNSITATTTPPLLTSRKRLNSTTITQKRITTVALPITESRITTRPWSIMIELLTSCRG